jgi:hypothetical protein
MILSQITGPMKRPPQQQQKQQDPTLFFINWQQADRKPSGMLMNMR